jgi:hypothetical protein
MSDSVHDNAMQAAQLDPREYERYVEVLQVWRTGERPSRSSRIWGRSRDERTLALFTLGILAIVIVVGTLGYVMTEATVNNTVVSSLTTLAGTAVGFIGGMVAGPPSKASKDGRRIGGVVTSEETPKNSPG